MIMASRFELRWKIAEYLKHNSDSKHPVKPTEIFSALKKDGFVMSDEKSRKAAIEEICGVLGCGKAKTVIRKRTIERIFYPHKFSYEDMDLILDAISTSGLAPKERCEKLSANLIDELTSNNYKYKIPINTLIPSDDKLAKNLRIIRDAISTDKQIEYEFFTHRENGLPLFISRRKASPYNIIYTGGHYYLLAIIDVNKKHVSQKIRIDLLQKIKVLPRTPRVQKREVPNFPHINDEYLRSHQYGAYDETKTVVMRIDKECIKSNKTAFLTDFFGSKWKSRGKDEKGLKIEVQCSSFAAVNFAMQYGDRVEILSPPSVRDEVIRRIKAVNEKYGLTKKDETL